MLSAASTREERIFYSDFDQLRSAHDLHVLRVLNELHEMYELPRIAEFEI